MDEQKWRLLIVDDEPTMAWFLADIAESEGYEIEIAENGDDGVARIEKGGVDAVFTDYRMPGRNGLDLIRYTRSQRPELPLVMITGYATVENTIEAFHLGVFDLLEKPFELSVGRALLQRLRETLSQRQRLQQRHAHLQTEIEPLQPLVAESEPMQHSVRVAKALSGHPQPLLLLGEPGSGRSTLARWVHRWSAHREEALLRIDGAAFRLEEVEEILSLGSGAVSLLLQQVEAVAERDLARILMLQRERGGGVFATVTSADTADPRFPLGLYHAFPAMVVVPPLREREEDIPLLIEQWMAEAAERWGCKAVPLEAPLLKQLRQYGWPGNLAQLRQQLHQQLLTVGEGEKIVEWTLQPRSQSAPLSELTEEATLDEVEQFWIEKTLQRLGGNRTRAAAVLGINPSTLFRKLGKSRDTLEVSKPTTERKK
ncbi:MAG: sigma-54-dependent Fis family transcriptional regulator [Gammaproteobacteria bacterium]|nr:sigma-54-dependent Fis family transcriptional regulator [Gammaproteobacteria bacterium]